ncbi:hypothetical protein ACFZC5_24420 [Nocardia gamkensis]|uniref:hypothetical protein n=1 Tax=Nocardia gamkensis TaxID=352869 RepID=UPI0036ED15B9
MIAPVIPPQSPLQELIYGPQVTNRVVRTPDGDVVYGLCTVGDGGRVLDKHTVTGLDWRPGSRQELTRFDAGLLLARKSPDGHAVIAASWYCFASTSTRPEHGQ